MIFIHVTSQLTALLIQFRFSVLRIIFQISISDDDTRRMVHFGWHLTASSKSPGPIRIILVFSNCGFLPIHGTTDTSDIKISVKYRQTFADIDTKKSQNKAKLGSFGDRCLLSTYWPADIANTYSLQWIPYYQPTETPISLVYIPETSISIKDHRQVPIAPTGHINIDPTL